MASACAAPAQLQAVQRAGQQQRRAAPAAVVTCSLRRSHSHAFTARPAGGLAPWQQQRRLGQRQVRSGDAAPSVGSGWMDQPESPDVPEAVEKFPRLKERDPYRRLGVSREASYEEVQEARNFLVEQYRSHPESKESIELALDSILQEKIKVRHRYGFKPPQRGKRTDVAGEETRQSLWQRVRSYFEPSVHSTTLVNDGSVFVLLGVWAAWNAATSAGASDPTLPMCAALAFSAYKLYEKRTRRSPDGPFMGGNAVWGAMGAAVLALSAGTLFSYLLVNFVLPPGVLPFPAEAIGFFVIVMTSGFATIFLK